MSSLSKLTKSVTKAVSKVYNGTVGDIINPSNGIVKGLTGLSNTQQLGVGASVGALNGLVNGTEGGLLSNLTGSGNNSGNNGLLSTLFGSGSGSGGSLLGDILGSVVKGAVGIGADYFSNQQYYKDQRKLNEQKFGYDRQLADEAYQRDVAMWNMQNAYNAPSEQMKRLQEAGMNPNLVYGSGNVTGNTAGSPPSYHQVSYPDSRAQKLDLARNVLGIFDDYQRIQNQALTNQRENARMALAYAQMQNAQTNADRNYELALANLGLRRDQMELMKSKLNQLPATVKNLNALEGWASDKSEALFSWLIPTVYNWWHRDDSRLDGSATKDVPGLF